MTTLLPITATSGGCCGATGDGGLDGDAARDVAATFKALADPARVRLLSIIAARPEGEACVQYSTQLGPQFHCSPIPEACGGTPSCACMAEVCVGPFDACSDGPDGMSCSCPVCG